MEIQLGSYADQIRQEVKSQLSSVIHVGKLLSEVKGAIDHGEYTPWLEREFGWSVRTAHNYVAVYELSVRVSDSIDLSEAPLGLKAAYKLAAKKTPKPVVDQALAKAAGGQLVTIELVDELIRSNVLVECVSCDRTLPESDFEGRVECPECNAKTEEEDARENPNGDPREDRSLVINGTAKPSEAAEQEDVSYEDEDENSEAAEAEMEELANDKAFSTPATPGTGENSPFAEIREIWSLVNKLSPSLKSRLAAEFAEELFDLDEQTIRKSWETSSEEEREAFARSIDWQAYVDSSEQSPPKPASGKSKAKKPGKFVPPTIEEVREFAEEKAFAAFDAEAFHDFYESKGWMVGKNKMQKWKAAASNWARKEAKEARSADPLTI